MFIVTIDSGTTNTRVRVWQGKTVIAEASAAIGVRDTVKTGSRDVLIQGVKKALYQAIDRANLQINRTLANSELLILASGMITANIGLCEIPHLPAPVGLAELAKGMVKQICPEIIDQPIWFIPGIKNHVPPVDDLLHFEQMDMMRGEETEAIGVIAQLNIQGPALIVLPGSHSKFVTIDQHNQILGCATTLAGELLDVITHHTLLTSSLEHQFATTIDEAYLLQGAASCRQVGFARSCFSVRILDLFSQATVNQQANFLLGSVLYSDILTIKNSQALVLDPNTPILVCGKQILKQALTLLLRHDDFFTGEIIAVAEVKNRPLSGLGAIALAEYMRIIQS